MPSPQRLQTRAGALEYVLSGAGSPNIVLLNGAGVTLEGWRGLYPDIEQVGTVFAWNRFGVDGSDDPRLAQNGAVVLASLRELLGYAGLQPPYLLVGHSLGALYANLFARLHPKEVSAVLFVEAAHPGDQPARERNEPQLTRALAKVQSLPQSLFRANLHSEIESAPTLAQEIDCAGPFPPVPIAVVSGGARKGDPAQHEELARLSPRSECVIAARSGHFPQLSEPQVVLEVLRRLVRRQRRGAG